MTLIRTAKEITRHTLHRLGVKRRLDHLKGPTRAERFSKIYESGVWSKGLKDVPLSGEGSSLAATATLRSELPKILNEMNARKLVDVGCGDFTWMSQVPLPCEYVGLDIVPSVVVQNQNKFTTDRRRFAVHDIVANAAPPADVVLCREVLFHLSFDDGLAALRSIIASGCTYVLLTSDRGTKFNSDIESGDFRLLNLGLSPFSFPSPIKAIDDGVIAKGRFLGLWRRTDLSLL